MKRQPQEKTLKNIASDKKGKAARKPPRATENTVEYNDLDLRRWKEYPEIETGSLWLMESRDRSNGHQLDYHGNFIPQIATQTFKRFSKEGEVVLDLFLGSGTSAIEAAKLKRRCIGVELNPTQVAYLKGKLKTAKIAATSKVIDGDSAAAATVKKVRAGLNKFGVTHAHLLVLHPPYHDIIRFSEIPDDLSNIAGTEEFISRFKQVAANGFELLAPGRFAALIIGDKYARGELVPLGFRCMQAMSEAGFIVKSIVVKNIEGNEKGKGRTNNLWRYRALAGGFYIFKHEYVIICQKPKR